MNTPANTRNLNETFENIKNMMKNFGIEITAIKKTSGSKYNLTTSHKKAVLFDGGNSVLNFDFLTFKDGKIETSYPTNTIIQKIIDYGNEYVDFFDALRLEDIETKKLYSYKDAVKAYIDFDFDWNNPEKHEIVLNFAHNVSSITHLITNKSVINSGGYDNMYIVFNMNGDMTVNRLNVARKRTKEAWNNEINSNFKEYGLLTEIVRI